MTSKASIIQRRFNRSAGGAYDAHANVQREMAEALAAQMRLLSPGGGRLLEIGCGTGVLTEKLLRLWPESGLTALDLSCGMIEQARRRIAAPSMTNYASTGVSSESDHPADSEERAAEAPTVSYRPIPSKQAVRFIAADAEEWVREAPSAAYDLVASSACFQWFARPSETLAQLRRTLRPGGLLAFATFGPGTFRELHAAFADAYRAAGLPPERHGLTFRREDEWIRLLEASGFADIRCMQKEYVERHDSVRGFLHTVKAVGASASEAAAPRGLGRRKLFADMFRAYESRFSADGGGIAATYETLLFTAAATP